MGKISVAYIIESLGPGGAERQLLELIRRLDRQRIDVRVLTFYPDNFFLPELERLGVPVYRFVRRARWDFRPLLTLIRWLRSGEVNLLHSYLYNANFYGVLGVKMAHRGRIIASERSLVRQYNGLLQIYSPWVYRHADLIIANSNNARLELIKRFKLNDTRVVFIPNGVDMETFNPFGNGPRQELRRQLGWPSSERVVLTISSYKKVKNHLGIIDSLRTFEVIHSGLHFCWAGPFDPKDEYLAVREKTERRDLTRFIDFLGPRKDVVSLYRASDIVLLNSMWEGTPNVVLEAMACRRPVIATDVSDVGRYVLPNVTGWLIPPDDPEALGRALREASEVSDAELDRMGAAGRTHLLTLKMDLNNLARRHEEIYSALVASG